METLERVRQKILANCPSPPKVKWRRVSDYSIVSEDGIFYVGYVNLNGERMFEVWAKPEPAQAAVCLRRFLKDGESAKAWAASFIQSFNDGRETLKQPLTRAQIERLREAAK